LPSPTKKKRIMVEVLNDEEEQEDVAIEVDKHSGGLKEQSWK